MTKYYRYHRNNGHTTDECKALRVDLIPPPRKTSNPPMLTLLSTVVTTEIMATPSMNAKRSISAALSAEKDLPIHACSITVTPPRSTHHKNRPNPPNHPNPQLARTDVNQVDPALRGTINTISGGFASGGSTSSVRKKHLRHIQSINHITYTHHRRRMPLITFTRDDFHGVDHQ